MMYSFTQQLAKLQSKYMEIYDMHMFTYQCGSCVGFSVGEKDPFFAKGQLQQQSLSMNELPDSQGIPCAAATTCS